MAAARRKRPDVTRKGRRVFKDAGGKATERAYAGLRERIAAGVLKPGRWYLQEELAVLLALSRTPVREALIKLAEEGWVTMRPRHGVQVKLISLAELGEIYEIMTALEAFAVLRMVEQGPTPELLALLRRAQKGMEGAFGKGDVKAWDKADEDFRRGLIRGSGNGQLMDSVDRLWQRARRAQVRTARYRTVPQISIEEHGVLMSHIESRDADAAFAARVEHCRRGFSVILALAESRGFDEI